MTYLIRSFVLVCLLLVGLGCSDKSAVKSSAAPPALAIGSPRSPLELIAGDGRLGSADFGEQRTCAFRLKNNLPQTMTLRLVDKSCTCAGVQMPTGSIESGQEATVTIIWSPKAQVLETSTVRLWAEVADATGQYRQRLEANGTIEPLVQIAFPRGPLELGKITPADINQDQTKLIVEVYSRAQSFDPPQNKLNIKGIQVVSTETLTTDRLNALQAKAGYRLTIRPTKDLTHGSIQAQLDIQTSLKPQPIQLDITGSLETSAISLSIDKLQLPPRVSLQSGYRLPGITLTTRYGACTRCEVAQIIPNLFDVKIQQLNDKTWKLEVSLTKDISQLQQRFTPHDWQQLLDFGFDQGSITLKLDHPDVKTLTIPITGSQLSRE